MKLPLHHHTTIDSTNLEAHRLFASGERGPLMIRADQQTAGKGRLGRAWTSEPGNLYTTLIWPVAAPLNFIPQLGFVVALAVHETVLNALWSKSAPKLKWPNDCLINGAKVSGILCEVLTPSPLTVALGCGINIAHAPQSLAYPATCLNDHGCRSTSEQIYQAYAQNLQSWLNIWNNGDGFPAIREAWAERAIGIGETISITTAHQTYNGTMSGIDEQGALVLSDANGNRKAYHAGDVTIPSLEILRASTPQTSFRRKPESHGP